MRRASAALAVRGPRQRGAQAKARDAVLAQRLDHRVRFAQSPDRRARVELELPPEVRRRLAQVDVLVHVGRGQLVEEVSTRDRPAIDHDALVDLGGHGLHADLHGAHREAVDAVELDDVRGTRQRGEVRVERLTRGVAAQDERRMERLEARGDRAVGGAVELEVRHHPEPLPGGVEMRLDLREQLVGARGPSLCARKRRDEERREGRRNDEQMWSRSVWPHPSRSS